MAPPLEAETERLLFEGFHVFDYGLGVLIRGSFGRLHDDFPVFILVSLFNRFNCSGIGQPLPSLRIGIILSAHFLPHLGIALAVRSVALGAVLLVERLAVCSRDSGGDCGHGERYQRPDGLGFHLSQVFVTSYARGERAWQVSLVTRTGSARTLDLT